MSSFFHLTLDTTAPALASFGPAQIKPDGSLVIPYALSEPSIERATLDGSGPQFEVGFTELRLNAGPRSGYVALKLTDDVGNTATVEREFNASTTGRLVGSLSGAVARAVKGWASRGWPGRAS